MSKIIDIEGAFQLEEGIINRTMRKVIIIIAIGFTVLSSLLGIPDTIWSQMGSIFNIF